MSPYCKELMFYGKELMFGKHEGKTIEQVHFIDYGWLDWALKQPGLDWIRNYVNSLPKIYPDKIRVLCGENHHAGCKNQVATRVSLLIDQNEKIIAHPGTAYYWCSECDIYSADSQGGLVDLPLNFESVLILLRQKERREDIEYFHLILRHAYGIRKLTPENAYEVFWE